MQQYIKNITSVLVDRLSAEQLYYSPTDLIEAGYPSFLVDRIQLELQRNLADSVKLPESDWADMKTDPVQDAWDHFLIAIRAETRIPSSFLNSVTENAVEDLLELLSQPRKSVLDTLFRSNEVCQIEELQARRKWIVINSILADALIRYLQRKGMTEISKTQAAYVINETDRLICAGFSPLKWAQHVEHWFELMGKEIPSVLMMQFFMDKDMRSVAHQFETGPEIVSRNRLIEILSTTDFDFEEPGANEKTPLEVVASKESVTEVDAQQWDKIEVSASDLVESENEESELPFELDDVELSDQEKEDSVAFSIPFEVNEPDLAHEISQNEDTEEDLPFDLDDVELLDHKIAESTASDIPFDIYETDLADNTSDFEESDAELDLKLSESSDEDDTDDAFSNLPFESDQKEEIPIWQRFASADDESDRLVDDVQNDVNDFENNNIEDQEEETLTIADISAMTKSTEDDAPIADLLGSYSNESSTVDDDEPHKTYSSIADLNKIHSDSEPEEIDDMEEINDEDVIYLSDEAKSLLAHLNENRGAYIDDIFRGDERAFYKQIGEISTYKNWWMAGKYITRDIFDKNRVDLYSDNAVLFTDAVQEYFEKKEN